MTVVADGGDPQQSGAAGPPARWPARLAIAVALMALLLSFSGAPLAGEAVNPPEQSADAILFGLTATQLAIAAGVGVVAGAPGALVSSNVISGASLGFGTLAAIYIAHLAAEALVVGGVYYWWPWETKPEGGAAPTMAIRGAERRGEVLPALQLAR